MDFAEIYGETANLAKLLEGRWFYGTSGPGQQRRPFLTRNLTYIKIGRNPNCRRAVQIARGKRIAKAKLKSKQKKSTPTSDDDSDGDDDKPGTDAAKMPVMDSEAFDKICQESRQRYSQTVFGKMLNPKTKQLLGLWEPTDEAGRTTAMNDDVLDSKPAAKTATVAQRSNQAKPAGRATQPAAKGAKRTAKKDAKETKTVSKEAKTASKTISKAKPAAKPDSAGYNRMTRNTKVTTMYFHFVYGPEDGYPVFQTETRNDRRCPFCLQDTVTDGGIVMHCNAFHGELITYEAVTTEDGKLHVCAQLNIDVVLQRPQETNDFFFCRWTEPEIASDVPIVRRKKSNLLTLSPEKRELWKQILMKRCAPPELIDVFTPCNKIPLRRYFHPESMLPMVGDEWTTDIDNHVDETWLETLASKMIDEFTDVAESEKMLMKLWNSFIHSRTLIADSEIPRRCVEFIHKHSKEMASKGLRNDLLLHLMNLWDCGMVSRTNLEQCMALFDSLQDEEPNDEKRAASKE